MDHASGYLLALASTLTATIVRFAMDRELDEKSRMMLFIPAVLASAWYGGVGPGIFALLLGALMAAWVLIPPITNLSFGDQADQLSFLLYLVVGAGIILLAHRERVEKRNRELAQSELLRVNLSLEERVRERTQELQTANQELEGFCYNVSHDLRTPTRAIVGNARILVEDFDGELTGPAREKLNRISNAALKLSDLVDALLVYARLAKADLKMEAVNLSELVSTEAASCAAVAGKHLQLTGPADMFVFGDKHQLRVAVSAIVSNAIKYSKSEQDATLAVACERIGSKTVVRFKDDGIGFDPQYMHKVFQPFERLHRDEDYPGVGMGLANVARIISRHRGEVWVETSVEHGTIVYLQFGNQPEMQIRKRERLSA
jgi:K+-sensing histidine kinase KdpD